MKQHQAAVGAWGISAFSRGFLKCHRFTSRPNCSLFHSPQCFSAGTSLPSSQAGTVAQRTAAVTTFLPAANPFALRWHFSCAGESGAAASPHAAAPAKSRATGHGNLKESKKGEGKARPIMKLV